VIESESGGDRAASVSTSRQSAVNVTISYQRS